MRVTLTENQLKKCILMEFVNQTISGQDNYNPISDGNSEHNPYTKQIKASNELLSRFLHNSGRIMTKMDNGRDYIVYEIHAFANLIGKRYGICQLIKDNEPFGAIYIKPISSFKLKIR